MAHVTEYEFCEKNGHDIYTVEESWAQIIKGCMRCTWQFVARADGG